MEIPYVENKLKKHLQNNFFAVLCVILIIYISNTHNHYDLFSNKLNELKHEVIFYKKVNDTNKRIIIKYSKCIKLIGSNYYPYKTNEKNGQLFLNILNPDNNPSTWITSIKIINLIKTKYPDISIIKTDSNIEQKENKNTGWILLLDTNNNILLGFPIDGKENVDEIYALAELFCIKIKGEKNIILKEGKNEEKNWNESIFYRLSNFDDNHFNDDHIN